MGCPHVWGRCWVAAADLVGLDTAALHHATVQARAEGTQVESLGFPTLGHGPTDATRAEGTQVSRRGFQPLDQNAWIADVLL